MSIVIGDASPFCYPAINKDESGNLYVAWYSDSGWICYRECINGVWANIEKVPVPWIVSYISHLSLKRINNKTYLVSISPENIGPGNSLDDCYLFYSVKDGEWQTEHIIGNDENPAGAGQVISENILVYNLRVDNNYDIYYQERIGTGWSEPICVKNTPAKPKLPQGCFDGESISLIWTEGDAVPYTIDTAKIRVIPWLEIVYPTQEAILGQRLRAGQPLLIKWTSSDNVGVVMHRVYYSLDNGISYHQIGGDLSGTTYQLNWVVPDTIISGLKIKIEAYDGAGMFCAKEVGPFATTKEFVFNSNFEEVSENKPYLWTNYGQGDLFEADWQEVQNGQFSAHIKRNASASYFGFYQEKIPVVPNKKYWLQGYIKTEASAGYANLAFGVWHAHPDTNHHRDFGFISGNTDWTYVCDSLTTRSYEDTIRVMMFGNPEFVGDAWFDNLTLLIDTIPPQVIVSYPNGGESLLVEQRIQVYWYATDNVKMGKIDSVLYSTNAGQTWNVIAVNLPANANSCEWTVPVWSQQYKIRVVASDASGNRSRDESDGVFGTKYFTYSGFEYTDPAGLDNVIVDSQGVKDCNGRVVGGYMNGVSPHSGNFMFKICGEDTSTTQNSYVVFKVFPYDFIVQDSTYFSFWLYIEDAPTDSGHICMDAYTKDGKILRNWNKFGFILDQTGQRIHPALHKAPKGQWCQYVFTFNPAVKETIDYLVLIYDDYSNSETGYFEGYIDDIEVTTKFPIPNCWHAEKFPTHPTYGDPNFYMNFIAQGDSVKLVINPQGDGGEGPHWVGPTPGIRNDITDIPVDENTMIYWEQFDKDHSLILSLLIHDNFGNDRWLTYAKNAYNHWYKEGWVDMGDSSQNYNCWQWFYRNIRADYLAEYGTPAGEKSQIPSTKSQTNSKSQIFNSPSPLSSPLKGEEIEGDGGEFEGRGEPPNGVEPEYIKEIKLEHFAYSSWVGDHGGTIKRLFIGVDTMPPVVQVLQPNGSEKLEIGSVYPIIWEATDNLSVGLQTIYYSTDGGLTWHNVTGIDTLFEPIASYQYNWTVPVSPSNNCLVKVVSKDIANNTGSDKSNAPFSICWFLTFSGL